jgi:hypothetical protein
VHFLLKSVLFLWDVSVEDPSDRELVFLA